MTNFNEKINWGTGLILRDQEYNYFIQKSDSIEEFERNIDCLQFRKDPYRLYIQYMDLIMILIREYGGAISSKMLYQLLDRCDYEYDQALQTIIDTGLLECSIRDDGDIACFYIP